MKSTFISLLLASFAFATTLPAQIIKPPPPAPVTPSQLSFQGQVAVDGKNFTGNGYFKFALLNSPGVVSLWSNDGSSVGGSEPKGPVTLPVMDGLYAVALGDTTLTNMRAIPFTVFTNRNVHLRVWFDDGKNGFQLLTPDQPVLSVGYAMMAQNVPDGSITMDKLAYGAIDADKILDGSITANELAPNSINSGHIINGEVHSVDLADNAVTSAKLAPHLTLGDNSTSGLMDLWSSADNALSIRLDGNNAYNGGQINLHEANGTSGLVLYGAGSDGSGAISLRNTDGNPRLRLYGGPSAGKLSLYNDTGHLNLSLWSYDGEEGVVSVRNKLGNETVYLWGRDFADSNGGQIGLKEANGTETLTLQASEAANNGAQIVLRKSNGTASIILDADQGGSGRITTQVLQITGGSDFSEQFDIQASQAALQPGMLVSIDPGNPGGLILSSHAYDHTAAGVISGAGGVKPGMVMGQHGTIASGKHPVALSGRVYCYADAGYGAIRPGDLITTSDTPGYGMRVSNHARAQGAIVGKAMTSLKSGRGLVLVLVSLQ